MVIPRPPLPFAYQGFFVSFCFDTSPFVENEQESMNLGLTMIFGYVVKS